MDADVLGEGSPSATHSASLNTYPQSQLAGQCSMKLINRPRRQQRPPVTLVPGLPARLAPRTILATPRNTLRRI